MSPDQKPEPQKLNPNQEPVDNPSLQVSPDLQFQEVPPAVEPAVAPAPTASVAGQTQPSSTDQPPQPQFQPPVPLSPSGASGPVVLGARHKRSKMPLFIVLIVLLLGGGAGAYLYLHGKNAKSTSTGSVTIKPDIQTKKAIKTNSWTGKANNFNWGDTANWSLGTPSNGQNLEIDMANVAQPKDANGTLGFAFQNNLANLTVNKLTIKGDTEGMLADVKGQPLSIAAGIDFTVVQTKTDNAIPQLQFDIPVTFSGDQAIHTTGRNLLTFTSLTDDDQTIDISDKTISFVPAGESLIMASDMIKGTGTLLFPKTTDAAKAGTSFNLDSPEFTGKVKIESGNRVTVSKTNPQPSVPSVVLNPFGKASVEIQDGATLGLNASGAGALSLPNDMTIGGKGMAAANKNAGEYSGAITACVSKGQGMCDLDKTATLSGKVTLSADAQFGAQYGGETAVKPPSTTVNYVLPQLTKASFTLSAVDGSKAVIK